MLFTKNFEKIMKTAISYLSDFWRHLKLLFYLDLSFLIYFQEFFEKTIKSKNMLFK